MIVFYKYQGAGNDFLIADNREGAVRIDSCRVAELCDRRYGIGADGLILLEKAPDGYDFYMDYYNSDGSGGMMCGNGGRCAVAFARRCGIMSYSFLAADGPHIAQILEDNGRMMQVRLRMKDVKSIRYCEDVEGWFLDTGTRHLVMPAVNLAALDVVGIGRGLRYLPKFGPIGVNVNFIERPGDILYVRTYEKGVEDETFACGTGIAASAIVDWHIRHADATFGTCMVRQRIRALRDDLEVDFVPEANGARDVYLTGPATYVAEVRLD